MTVSVPTFKVVTTIQRKSGIERDAIQNTWHYLAPSATPTGQDYGNWMNTYKTFLNDLSSYYSACLTQAPDGIRCEFYRVTPERPAPGSGLGPPTSTGTMGWTAAPTNAGLPAECSVVLSLDGTLVTDAERGPGDTRPAARKRNRKFIGPLALGVVANAASTLEVIVKDTVRTAILNAFMSKMNTAMAPLGWNPVVFSPSNWATTAIKNLWVNDAFDTQRRRGEDPSLKSTVPVEGALAAYIARHAEVGIELHDDGFGNLIRV